MTLRITGNWVYKDQNGIDWIRIKRQEDENGKKSFLPENLKIGVYKMPDSDRPLYNLPKLFEAHYVVFVEGEKCAQALIDKGICATTTMGGSNAPAEKTDFKSLKDKVVIIWPDNDDPGLKYAQSIRKAALEAGAIKVEILQPPLDKPKKWDAADAAEEGFDCMAFIEKGERYEPANLQAEEGGILSFCMDDIELKPVKWLWQDRISLGKPTAFAGHPGLGKSQITISIAAITSTGGIFPDGTKCNHTGHVLFLSAEDDAEDTIKPRLMAAGADLKKCHTLHAVAYKRRDNKSGFRSFDLKQDVERLEQKINEIGNVRLVIIDPISAYLGDTDSHNNADIRGLLAPLSAMAARNDVAVLLITHFNKSSSQELIERFIGSIGLIAAARAGYAVIEAANEKGDQARYLLPVKNNIGNDKEGFSYHTVGVDLGNGIKTSKIIWHQDLIDKHKILNYQSNDKPTQTNAATAFLAEILNKGSMAVRDIIEQAEGAGYSKQSMQRAKNRLKAKHKKDGYNGGWIWYLDNSEDTTPK